MSEYATTFDEYKQSFSADGFMPAPEAPLEDASALPLPDGVEGHEGSEADEGGQPERQQKKKNAHPSKKRIDQLVYQKGAVEQQNAFLAQQLAEREAVMAQMQQNLQETQRQLAQKEELANSSFEQTAVVSEISIKNELKRAKEEGDIDREVELLVDLAAIKSQKASHDLDRRNQIQYRQQQIQNEAFVPYETQVLQPVYNEAPIDEDFQEWVNENPWYENNPKLRGEADAISQELADYLTFNNIQVSSDDFRDTVTKEMRKRYGGGQQQQAPEEAQEDYYEPQQQQQQRAVVAPVTRRGMSMADQYVNNKGLRPHQNGGAALSKEEMAIARNLSVKGGNFSEIAMANRYRQGKAYPASPLPGGTPNRLTIL